MAKKSVTTNNRPTKDPRMNCGVYKITNTANGKIYVGSTNNFSKRRLNHFSLLSRGKHHNVILQRIYDKDKNSLIFEILFVCSIDMLEFYEQIMIDEIKPEYNISPYAASPMRGRFGELHPTFGLTGEKCASFGRKGSKHHQSKSVVHLNTGTVYGGVTEAARKLGLQQASITRVCRGEANQTKGQRFAFADGTSKPCLKKQHSRPVIELTSGTIYVSGAEAARCLGLYRSDVTEACRTGTSKIKQYRFEYHV